MSRRLESIGVKDSALRWFQSYLKNRTQAVNINGTISTHVPLKYGVPQGSVLGPILFTNYSSPIARIARKHGLPVYTYADDTQIYVSFNLNDRNDEMSARQRAEACILEIKSWMSVNKLKLNDDKTEFLIMTSRYNQRKICDHHIKIDTSCILASKSARNLGIVFDNNLCMDVQVRRICQSVYYHIRNVNSIRKILTFDTAATIIHALITSRIDNGNSLLFGITDHLLHKLQLLQNAAARILTKTRKFDHITPILKDLHWLPVRQRIHFKLLLLTWKALHGTSPTYIANILVPYHPKRTLRSSDKLLLVVPRTNSSFGDRAFSVAAPIHSVGQWSQNGTCRSVM